jgi:hypothetical protein
LSVVLDDHLLLAALSGRRPPQLDEVMNGEAVYTTGCWYYRLARAAAAGTGEGSLSGELARLDPTARTRAAGSLERLPDVIGLISYRTVVPVMVALRVSRLLNMLTAEALAVALITSSRLLVSVESPLLRLGANDLEIPCTVLR